MTRYVLDTSAYSDFQRGDAKVVELIDAAKWIGVPSVVLGELWASFLLRHRASENLEQTSQLTA